MITKSIAVIIKKTAPVLISIGGVLISFQAIRNAVIIPETRMAIACTAVWGCLALKEIVSLFLEIRRWVKRKTELQRIDALISLLFLYSFVLLPYMAGIMVVRISGSIICSLCLISALFVASGDVRSAKILLCGIFMVEIAGVVLNPAAIWDLTKCSIEVFMILHVSELLFPVYILCLMPDEPMSNLFAGLKNNIHITGISGLDVSLSNTSIRRIRIVHVLICLISVVFLLFSREQLTRSFVNVLVSVIFVIVISELMERPNYNGPIVAFPVFVRLVYDLQDNRLVIASDYYSLYIGAASIALFAAIRAKKGLFLYAESIGLFVLFIDLLSFSANTIDNISDYSGMLALYGSEIMLYVTFLLFAIGNPWSDSVAGYIKEFLFFSEDDFGEG